VGGDVFKFIQMRENLTFPQAVERLAHRAGIEIKLPKARKAAADNAAGDIDPNRLAKVNAWAAKYFSDNLWHEQKGASAREYLAKRQISVDTAKNGSLVWRWQMMIC